MRYIKNSKPQLSRVELSPKSQTDFLSQLCLGASAECESSDDLCEVWRLRWEHEQHFIDESILSTPLIFYKKILLCALTNRKDFCYALING